MRAIVPAIILPLIATGLMASRDSAVAQAGVAVAAKTVHHRHHRRPRPYSHYLNEVQGGQIACTPLGCGRIPRNCHPTTAYYPDGTPTGYDAVACP